MIRKLAVGVVLALLAVAAGGVATGAFTTETAERAATVTVATDENGLLRLVDGHSGGLIRQTASGTLEIDFTLGGAAGATEGTVFEFGSAANPVSNHAFRIVNRGTTTRDVEVAYELASGASDGAPGTRNVAFTFALDRDTDGSIEATYTIGEGGSRKTIPTVGVGDTIYVTLTVDTTGLSSTSDLTGTLDVTG